MSSIIKPLTCVWAHHRLDSSSSVICGLTQFTTKAHIARATLESVCYQTRDIVEVMARDAGVRLKDLRIDGGMTANDLLVQLQSDILGIPISTRLAAVADRPNSLT